MARLKRRQVLLWIQAVLCAALCAALAASAVLICREGTARRAGDPAAPVYTREGAAEALGRILPLFLAAAVSTAAALALGAGGGQAEKASPDLETARDLLCARVSAPSPQMLRERKRQRRLRLAGAAAGWACAVPPLCYLLSGARLASAERAATPGAVAAHILPWIIAGTACAYCAELRREKSLARELEAARDCLRASPAAKGTPLPAAGQPAAPAAVGLCLLALAAALIVHGIWNGSMRDVLYKAVVICTECVGLG